VNAQRELVLEVENLSTHIPTERGVARAIDGVTFSIAQGETLALLGESGSGKSTVALSILRLVPPPGEIISGSVRFQGRDLMQLSERELRAVRGAGIALVPQEPLAALDPLFTIGHELAEVLRSHGRASRAAAGEQALRWLERVGIDDPARVAAEIPSRLSGGQRQRALIALALACDPALLIADEPTTSLDAVLQAEVLDLLDELARDKGRATLFIAHDLGLVAQRADRAAVIHAGRIVESAPVRELFESPRHPYTILLLRSMPGRASTNESRASLGGVAHGPTAHPSGCRFRKRCPIATEHCKTWEPLLEERGVAGHTVACHHLEEAQRL
jgi:oligopeptide/dipeptide ABC transporter ATP-binding protein